MTGVLVGRRAELDATAAFLDVAARRPAALVLDGEAGIGKTALWAAGVAEARRRGFRVLSAEPTEAETLLPYVSLADLLGQVEDAVLDRLPVPQRRAVDGVLLRAAGPAPVDHRSVAVAFLGVLERLSEAGPVLLAIDDVQWVDASSALVLGYGLRRLAVAAGVLATCRTGADDDGPAWCGCPSLSRCSGCGSRRSRCPGCTRCSRSGGCPVPAASSPGSRRSRAGTRSTRWSSPAAATRCRARSRTPCGHGWRTWTSRCCSPSPSRRIRRWSSSCACSTASMRSAGWRPPSGPGWCGSTGSGSGSPTRCSPRASRRR